MYTTAYDFLDECAQSEIDDLYVGLEHVTRTMNPCASRYALEKIDRELGEQSIRGSVE